MYTFLFAYSQQFFSMKIKEISNSFLSIIIINKKIESLKENISRIFFA